jgi:hypothetical protein
MVTYVNIHFPVELVSNDQLMSNLDPEWFHGVLSTVVE